MPPLGTPLANFKFNLNSTGVAGFFGGEEVLSTIGIMHLYEGRRWFGWYNNPGSYHMAKHLGRTVNLPFWNGLFPGPTESPAMVFGLDIKKGPRYIAALSGTSMLTGHLAHLTMELSKDLIREIIEGRVTKPIDVTYLAMPHVDYDAPVKQLPLRESPKGLVPTFVSIVTCIMCALVYDWFSFSMILLGIVSSGCANLVVSEQKLVIEYEREPPPAAPPGHGILIGEREVVVIKGEERDVNVITRGSFKLEMDSIQEARRKIWRDEERGYEQRTRSDEEKDGVHSYHAIGRCSLLLLAQFFLQLLLVPQGSLFGQIMFLISLGASWGYNSYLSSLGVQKGKMQAEILFQTLGKPEMRRFLAGTRTTMTVFVCLLLFHKVGRLSPEKDNELRAKILHGCIPNDTDVWKLWKKKVVQQLLNIDEGGSDDLPYLTQNRELSGVEEQLLEVLLGDARAAFKKYLHVREELPDDSTLHRG